MITIKKYPIALIKKLTIEELWEELAKVEKEAVGEYKHPDYYEVRDRLLKEIIRKEELENS